MSATRALGSLGLGSWDGIVRHVAGYDFERAQRVASWPVHEVLFAHLNILREHAAEAYRSRMLAWASMVAHVQDKRPPRAPAILTDED